ncbi:MAG: nuclear transport factor 2 family protein [Chitinophagaceae bacterium]|nr:nuclear transport factor 2 family protein [Chitinophagaceae bacterium]MBK9533219.1 nuclear transport factor 2 family protein [Chitinophagaceae bacterium]
MMQKVKLLLITLLLSATANAQTVTTEQIAVQHTVINMFDALSNRDSVRLKAYCTANITLYEYGQVWNMDTLILKAITQNQSAGFKRTNHFEFINTTVDKNSAWVTYRLQSVINREGKTVTVQWLETVTLAKEKKQWKIKHLHSTLIKRS